MTISLIVAMAENRIIGRDNAIPWDLPEDRTRFRSLTMGHPVIMGRRTFQSLSCRLDGRTVIVISRNRDFSPPDAISAGTLEDALLLAAHVSGSDEIFIAGGGELYRQALALVDRIYLTLIHCDVSGDVSFPELPGARFVEVYREELPGVTSATFMCLKRTELYSERHSRAVIGFDSAQPPVVP